MKKLFLSVVMLFMAMSVFAQEQETKVRVPSGYQGFVEQGNTWHFDKNMPNSISLSTTHGFYFNGHIFAGIGLGVDFNKDRGLVPFYTNLRYQFNNNKVVSPVISLRLGSFIGEDMGGYGDLAFGVRFASKRDFAVSVLVAGTYYDKIEKYYNDYDAQGNYTHGYRQVSPSGISLRIGIEW
ncbi:MAG: hypothetical protein IKU00_10905 [Bacteroidales bacterium]|nr:hypothetical protein [Bacteroidales bacterium]